MCIAIAKPAGIEIDKETLKECFRSNPDGCGFAYIDDNGDIVIFKSMDFEPFYVAYSAAYAAHADSPFLIHFRIKTHGTKDIFNCHPFSINADMAFIHNGIIRLAPDCPDKRCSDTQMFNTTILQGLPDGWHKDAAIRPLIEEYIGSTSKLVVLDRRDRSLTIFCESKGHWHEGAWWSNTSYKKYTSTTTYSSTGYYSRDNYHSRDYTVPKRYCKYCNCDVTYNIYAKNLGKDFCCKIHRKIWEKEQADKSLTETKALAILNHTMYDVPKENIITVNDNTPEETSLIKCQWCNVYHAPMEIVEVEFVDSPEELICLECLSQAVELKWVEKTPQVEVFLEIYATQKGIISSSAKTTEETKALTVVN